jgi:hypothetical protein
MHHRVPNKEVPKDCYWWADPVIDADDDLDKVFGGDKHGEISEATWTMMVHQFSQKDDNGHDKDFMGLGKALNSIIKGFKDTLYELGQEGVHNTALITDPILRAQAVKAQQIAHIKEQSLTPFCGHRQ